MQTKGPLGHCVAHLNVIDLDSQPGLTILAKLVMVHPNIIPMYLYKMGPSNFGEALFEDFHIKLNANL